MFLNAKNAAVADMDYIRFGGGSKTLIILPGLGDGLRTVKGTALPMAAMYRIFARDYTVFAFSRKNTLAKGATTRDMARDLAQAMETLGIAKADVFGVSMGGMIAQHLAIDYPEKVGKLVLTVTCPRPNPILEEAIQEWVGFANRGDHTALMDSNVRRIYSDGYYRRNKWLIPIMGKLTKPKSYDRFLIQAAACRTHDAWDNLPRIQAPTLVIGGEGGPLPGRRRFPGDGGPNPRHEAPHVPPVGPWPLRGSEGFHQNGAGFPYVTQDHLPLPLGEVARR